MSRTVSEETLEAREKVLAYIQRNPGATLERITIFMGLSVGTDTKARRVYPESVRRVVRYLLESGAIRAEREQFATNKEPLKHYAADYQPPKKRPLFQPGRVPPLKVWIDPAIAGTAPAAPVRSSIEDLPSRVSPLRERKEESEVSSPAYRQKLTAFKKAVDQMVAGGSIKPLTEIARDAGLHSNWGHTNPEGKEYYLGALEKMRRQGASEPPAEPEPEPEAPAPVALAEPAPPVAVTVALEEELHRLKQELEEKQRQLSQLQWEVEENDRQLEAVTAYSKDLEARLNQVEPTADPYPWILQQRDLWREKVNELTADLHAAEKNYAAFKRLADLYETPTEETNGNTRTSDQVSGDNRDGQWANGDHVAVVDGELSEPGRNGSAVAGLSPLG